MLWFTLIEFNDIYFSLNTLTNVEIRKIHLQCLILRTKSEHKDDKELQQLHERFYISNPVIYTEYDEEDIADELQDLERNVDTLVYFSKDTSNGSWSLQSLPLLIAAVPISEEIMYNTQFLHSHTSRIVIFLISFLVAWFVRKW